MTPEEIEQIAKDFADQKVLRIRAEVHGVDVSMIEDICIAQAREVLQFASQRLQGA